MLFSACGLGCRFDWTWGGFGDLVCSGGFSEFSLWVVCGSLSVVRLLRFRFPARLCFLWGWYNMDL